MAVTTYREGSVDVVNGSALVTLNAPGIASGNVLAGHIFQIDGDDIAYTVAADGAGTSFTLTAPYVGGSANAVAYSLNRDFVEDVPVPRRGDVGPWAIMAEAVKRLLAKVNALATQTASHTHDGIYAPPDHEHVIDDVNGLQATLDAAAAGGRSGHNFIVNGGLGCWTDGTSFADVNGYVAEQFHVQRGGGVSGAGVAQVVGITMPFAMRVTRNAGNTQVAAITLAHALETKESVLLRGDKMTFSFRARALANYSAAGGTLGMSIVSGTGSDQHASTLANVVENGNAVLTTSWQKFTLTSSAVIEASVTQLGVNLSFTPVGTAGAADGFEVEDLRLDRGDMAQDTVFVDEAVERLRCQRFYRRPNGLFGGLVGAGNVAAVGVQVSPPMRVTPSVGFVSGGIFNEVFVATRACDSLHSSSVTKDGGFVNIILASAGTPGNLGVLQSPAFALDARF
ncbi:MAG: hypothetical protein RLN89_08480 [Parvibaculum sp.]